MDFNPVLLLSLSRNPKEIIIRLKSEYNEEIYIYINNINIDSSWEYYKYDNDQFSQEWIDI